MGITSLNKNRSTKWQHLTEQGKGFTVNTLFLTLNQTETPLILLRNPVGNSMICILHEYIMTIGATATQNTIFKLYRNPTLTNDGTPLVINKILATGTQTSTLFAFQSPVVTANGTFVQVLGQDWKSLPERRLDEARYIAQGTDILVTVQGSANNIENNIIWAWAENNRP